MLKTQTIHCAYCSDPIDPNGSFVLTGHGAMHPNCATCHECETAKCRKCRLMVDHAPALSDAMNRSSAADHAAGARACSVGTIAFLFIVAALIGLIWTGCAGGF